MAERVQCLCVPAVQTVNQTASVPAKGRLFSDIQPHGAEGVKRSRPVESIAENVATGGSSSSTTIPIENKAFDPPSQIERKAIKSIVNKLNSFISISGSTATGQHSNDGLKRISKKKTAAIVSKVLRRNPEEVIKKYDDLFLGLKDAITEKLAVNADEKNIHPLVEQILKLMLTMAQAMHTAGTDHQYCKLRHEVKVASDDETNVNRDIPDFDVHLLAHGSNSADSKVLTSLFCCVVKKPCRLFRGVLQSLHYLAKKILAQIEVFRNICDTYFGVCFATDGKTARASHMCIQNMKLLIEGDISTSDRLWFLDRQFTMKPRKLKRIQAFVHMLAAFDCTPSQLGHKDGHDMYGVPGCQLISLLGVGSFSSCVEVEWSGKRYAIKTPRYTSKIKKQEKTVQRYEQERLVLALLNEKSNFSESIPLIADELTRVINSSRCIVMGSVGMSLQTAIISQDWKIRQRRKEAVKIEEVLSGVLSDVHKTVEICHCDVAPGNILLKMKCDGSYVPMIIDWELATKIGEPHHRYSGRLDIMHQDLIEAPADGVVISASPIYDLVALQYSMTCFVYNDADMVAPWSMFEAGSPEFYRWRDNLHNDKTKKWTQAMVIDKEGDDVDALMSDSDDD